MEGGGLNANMNKQIGNNGAIYVYYKIAEPTKPMVICISEGPPSDPSKNTWYKAGDSATDWSEDKTNFTNKDPSATGGDTQVTDTVLDAAGAKEFTPPGTANYVIKLDKRPLTAGSGNKIKYRTGNEEFTVERKDGTTNGPVPDNYVRYDHKPTTAGSNFTLSSVKHNDHVLGGISGGTKGVTAVYVYYRGNSEDNDHQFPLIVCVKTTTSTYYQRGNKWTTIDNLTADPETLKDADLNTLKGKFEVKLEKTDSGGGKYLARPGNATEETNKITVSPVTDTTNTYKGFKHSVVTNDVINRVTIHGQAITQIPEAELTGKKFVFVYFPLNASNQPELEKPLLICLSPTGGSGSSNKWYSRGTGNAWTNASPGTEYDEIDPGSTGTIDGKLKGKLQGISGALPSNDKGYPPLGYVLKLDYVAKNNTAPIKYVTGDNNDPSKRVITVTKKDPDQSTVPDGYVRYKHERTDESSFNLSSVKHNGFPLNGITQENNVQAVYVYYHTNDSTKHEFPLIVCVKKEGGQTYYKRGNQWQLEGTLSSVDPENPSTNLRTLGGKLEELKLKYEIDIGKTNTIDNGTYKANAEGQEITVTPTPGNGQNGVPTDYIRYEYKLYNISFKLVFVMYNDIIGVYPVSDLWELEGELIREGLHGEWKR